MRKEYSDARKSCKKLASRTGRRHFVRDGAIARWVAIEMGQYGLGNVRGVKNILLFLQGRLERCGYERQAIEMAHLESYNEIVRDHERE